ncbi:MAG: hypothetical protein R3E10_02730 [Gemmatimonadota bacterium]
MVDLKEVRFDGVDPAHRGVKLIDDTLWVAFNVRPRTVDIRDEFDSDPDAWERYVVTDVEVVDTDATRWWLLRLEELKNPAGRVRNGFYDARLTPWEAPRRLEVVYGCLRWEMPASVPDAGWVLLKGPGEEGKERWSALPVSKVERDVDGALVMILVPVEDPDQEASR